MHRIPSIESRFPPEFLAKLEIENRNQLIADLNEELGGVIFTGLSAYSASEIHALIQLKFSILHKIDILVDLSHEMMRNDISFQHLQMIQQEFLIVFQHILERKELIRAIMLKTHE